MYNEQRLIELVREKALEVGDFTLASGKKASFYLDCRKLTLDSEGAIQVAAGMWEKIENDVPDAVGGMAVGSVPIAAAIICQAGMLQKQLSGFFVRKDAKQHGTGKLVEGPVSPGQTAVIVEDVVTTGGSSVTAIESAREFGLQINKAITIIDRGQGGAEAFQSIGVELISLLTLEQLGISQ